MTPEPGIPTLVPGGREVDRRAKKELMARLERDAQRICMRFRLRYRVLEPERANVKRRYGVCFSDGTIRIRLTHVTTRQPLKYSSLVNTLCHELAHLRHFNHGPRFQAYYAEILEWARREGIYRPGPEPKSAPIRASTPAPRKCAPGSVQLDAFAATGGEGAEPEARPPGRKRTTSKSAASSKAGQLELFG